MGKKRRKKKKLRLSRTDRKIAGVCGGLASYLNMDSTLLRLIMVILFLCGTIGLWVYIIAWLIMPK
ncbi:MAG: PspC domain-containing protein [Prevotella sp.]|nr:PspC domain-containing protein [Prevotella sp.]